MGFMGGFSQGFGDSFSRSFAQTRDINARKEEKRLDAENDIYLKTMSMHEETVKELAEQKRKDAAMVATAKTLAETYDAPPEMILSRLKEGVDSSTVESLLKQGPIVAGGAGLSRVQAAPPTSAANANNSGRNIDPSVARTDPSVTQTEEMLQPDNREPTVGLDEEFLKPMGDGPEMIDDTLPPTPTTPITPGVAPASALPPVSRTVDLGGGLTQTRQQKVDIKQEYENAIRAGDTAKIAELKPMVEQLATVGRAGAQNKIQLQDELSRAIKDGNVEEATRIQSVIDQTSQSEETSQVIVGSQYGVKGVYLDNNGDKVLGVIRAQRTPEGSIEWVDENDEALIGARPVGEQEQKDLDKVMEVTQTDSVRKQQSKVANLTSAIRSSAKIARMVDQQDVLANVTGGVANFIDQGMGELKASARLLGVEIEQNSDGSYSSQDIDYLEKQIAGVDINSVSDLARKQALFNAELSIMAYRAGDAEGQTGQAFTEKDFNRISEALRGKTDDPATFKSALSNYMDGTIRKVDTQSEIMANDDAQIRMFQKTYGYNPVGEIIPKISDYIADAQDDPDLVEGYRFIRENAGKNKTNTRQEPTTELPRPTSREEMMALEPGTPFIDPNGVRRIVPPRNN